MKETTGGLHTKRVLWTFLHLIPPPHLSESPAFFFRRHSVSCDFFVLLHYSHHSSACRAYDVIVRRQRIAGCGVSLLMRLLQLLASGFHYLSAASRRPAATCRQLPSAVARHVLLHPGLRRLPPANYDGLMMMMTMMLMLIKYGRTAPADVTDTAKTLGLSLTCHLSMMR